MLSENKGGIWPLLDLNDSATRLLMPALAAITWILAADPGGQRRMAGTSVSVWPDVYVQPMAFSLPRGSIGGDKQKAAPNG